MRFSLLQLHSTRETGEPGRIQDRSEDRRPRQVNCLPNLAWTKTVWRCRLRVCMPIGSQMPVFITCEIFCQATKAGAVGCRPVCWAVLNASSPVFLPCELGSKVHVVHKQVLWVDAIERLDRYFLKVVRGRELEPSSGSAPLGSPYTNYIIFSREFLCVLIFSLVFLPWFWDKSQKFAKARVGRKKIYN